MGQTPTMDVSVLRELTQVKDMPPEMTELMWAFFEQENVWANTKEYDEKLLTELFLICWDWVEYMSPEEIHPQLQLKFLNLFTKFKVRLARSRDGFEREKEITTVAQAITPQKPQKGNMFTGFFRRVGLM